MVIKTFADEGVGQELKCGNCKKLLIEKTTGDDVCSKCKKLFNWNEVIYCHTTKHLCKKCYNKDIK